MENIDRPLTDKERGWLIRGLAVLPTGHAFGGGLSTNYHTGEATSLDPFVGPYSHTEDDRLLNVFVNKNTGLLAELEII